MLNDLTPSKEATISRGRRITGIVLSVIPVLFLVFDGAIKVIEIAPVVKGFEQMGYPVSLAKGIGIVLLACVALYVIPQTSVLGALLLTGYLGGAVASHVRLENPWLGYTLFPIYVAMLLWGGLVLRDERLRQLLLPIRPRSRATAPARVQTAVAR